MGTLLIFQQDRKFAKEISELRTDVVAHIVKVEEQPILVGGLERSKDKPIADGRDESKKQLERSADKEEIKQRIRELWGDEAERALKVARGESGYRADAIGDDGKSIGIFQINLPAHWKNVVGESYAEKITNLKNYEYNIWFARWLWEREGWCPWSVARNLGYCKK